jgi:hypothetical protein
MELVYQILILIFGICGIVAAIILVILAFERDKIASRFEFLCSECKTVWHSEHPVIGYCAKCGKLLSDCYEIVDKGTK